MPARAGIRRTTLPISTIGTYVPVMQEFINHWTQTNIELEATPLLLSGGYTVANFASDRTALENAVIALNPADNTRSNTAADRDIKKAALRVRLTQFRAAVKGLLYGSIYTRSIPKMPLVSATESTYLKPFDDMANLWGQINAVPPAEFTAPLALPGSYLVASFVTELAALRAAYVAASNATANARIARDKRNVLLPIARARMQQYRSVVIARLASNSPLLASVPAYTPPPGSTPQAVTAIGKWNAATAKADITWTPSTNAALDYYSVRTAPAPTYKGDEETAIASVPKTQIAFSTDAGLAAPGSIALFKVYVVTTTGNERGSATVKVTRPDVS